MRKRRGKKEKRKEEKGSGSMVCILPMTTATYTWQERKKFKN
jgi:hypothetical protein